MKTKTKKTIENIAILLFVFLILLPLFPFFWLIKDNGKAISDKEYEKMKKEADDSIYGLITFF